MPTPHRYPGLGTLPEVPLTLRLDEGRPGQLAEFARKRVAIYEVQDQIWNERDRAGQQHATRNTIQLQISGAQREIARLQAEILRLLEQDTRLEEDLSLGNGRQDHLAKRLTCRMEEMQHFLDAEQAVRVYTDMSLIPGTSKAAFGGLVIEGGGLTTMAGDLTYHGSDSNICEAMAMCGAVEWAAKEWPKALLEVFSDNAEVVASAEAFVRLWPAPRKSKIKLQLYELFHNRLKPHRSRFFPRWIPREHVEIRVCDALARRRLGLVARRTPWLRMLELTQGGVRGTWSPAAMWALHNYHRASKKGGRLEHDQRSSFPPA